MINEDIGYCGTKLYSFALLMEEYFILTMKSLQFCEEVKNDINTQYSRSAIYGCIFKMKFKYFYIVYNIQCFIYSILTKKQMDCK